MEIIPWDQSINKSYSIREEHCFLAPLPHTVADQYHKQFYQWAWRFICKGHNGSLHPPRTWILGMPGTCSVVFSKVHMHRHHISCAKKTTLEFIPVLAPESLSKLTPSHTYILKNWFLLLCTNFLKRHGVSRVRWLHIQICVASFVKPFYLLALRSSNQIHGPIISPQRAPFPKCFLLQWI